MDKTAWPFLIIKMYRKKITGIIIFIMLISITGFISTSLFFITRWSGLDNKDAQDHFWAMDRNITVAREQLSDYVDSMYGSRSLMQDAKSFFQSEGEPEYLKKRLENSKNSSAQIAYLPGNLKKLFISPGISLCGATILSDAGIKAIWLDPVSGDIRVTYHLQAEEDAVKITGFGDFPIKSFHIRDETSAAGRLGTITFWIKKHDMFVSAPRHMKWAVMGNRFVYRNSDVSKETAWLNRAAEAESSRGWFLDGDMQPVFYTRMQSGQMDCAYIAAESLFMVCEANINGLGALVVTIAVIAIGAAFVSFSGIHNERKFLLHIMRMLEAMENGRFSDAQAMDIRIGRQNEYGMIVFALQKVSRELAGYIRKECILKLKQQESAMLALRRQINPHFLYNTLESIRAKALIRNDEETAEAIALLGSLYRKLLRSPEIISLKEEVQLLELYLKVMSLRFAGSFVYQLQLEKEAESFPTVSFWLQPLAENFFNHGLDQSSDFNLLLVSIQPEKRGIHVFITDNGLGILEERLMETRKNMYEDGGDPGTAIGLRNVYFRLRYFYGTDFKMDIGNQAEGGVCISIFLPNLSGKE